MIDKFKDTEFNNNEIDYKNQRDKQLNRDKIIFDQVIGSIIGRLKDEEERKKRKKLKIFEEERQRQLESDRVALNQILMNIKSKIGGMSRWMLIL